MNSLTSLSVDQVIQLLSIAVYLVAILYAGFAVSDIRRSSHSISVKYIASGIVALSTCTAIMFIAAQIPWALTEAQEQISFAEAISWLMYDWLNGFAHLLMILSVRSFMRWENKTPCQHGGVCPTVQIAKRDREQARRLTGIAHDIEALQKRIELLDNDQDDLK
jgi:hypothetical protein